MFVIRILGGGLHTKGEQEALLVASKETDLEINAEKNKYMAMSRDQQAGHNHKKQTDNKYFKYLVTALTNQNSIHEEIKKSEIACYHSVQ